MATYNFTRHPPPISIYTRFRVKGSHRALKSPRVAKAWRTRKLMSLTAFFRNRFYEIDRWYKARIEKPEVYPTCYTIDPDNHAKSLVERLEELDIKAKAGREFIDIGLPFDQNAIVDDEKRSLSTISPERKAELERLARLKQLHIDPREVEGGLTRAAEHTRVRYVKRLVEHFGIFGDLFHKDAYFYPVTNLHVGFPMKSDPELINPVFYGNSLMPSDALNQPEVNYKSDPDTFYTLLMVNPDGNIYEENKEVLHWLVCNIPGNDVTKGEVVCNYLQPLPLKGTGWHRIVFVLFKQENRIDMSQYKLENPCKAFKDRTFNTPEFYLKNEDHVTPIGLAFFQTFWDRTCTTCFHEHLDMEQPIYDFDWPGPYIPPQEEFPAEYQPFNLYLDKYRDYRDIEKELLMKRLKRISPFKADEKRLKFPNVFYYDEKHSLPTWLHLEKIKENEGYGKYKSLYENRLD